MPASIPTVTPMWKRERPAPIQGPKLPTMHGPKRVVKPFRFESSCRKARRPINIVKRAIFAGLITATIALNMPTQAHAQFQHDPQPVDQSACDLNAGPDGTLGALLYVREVFDDAVEKQRRFKANSKAVGVIEQIETRNDFLCDVPASHQPVLAFMTENLLVFILDIMNLG